jgi:hypothetical protein
MFLETEVKLFACLTMSNTAELYVGQVRDAMIAHSQTFKDCTIVLDGCSFYTCTFERCVLIYTAALPVILDKNTFAGCRWEFAGAAQETLAFMAGLYADGATEIIEATFDHVRGKSGSTLSVMKL